MFSNAVPLPQRDEANRPASRVRVTPYSLEMEQSTLGAMIRAKDACARGVERLVAEDFHIEAHKAIFVHLAGMLEDGKPIDFMSVAFDFTKEARDAVGGAEYLQALDDACPSSANIDAYIEIVLANSYRRRILKAAYQMQDWAHDEAMEADKLLSSAQEAILAATRTRDDDECESVGNVAVRVAASTEAQVRRGGAVVGISTGLPSLDAMMGGYRANHLIVLGARPAMGKSSLALLLAYLVAVAGHAAVFFCFEMGREELVQRLISMLSGIDSKRIERGLLDDEEMGLVADWAIHLQSVPLYIQDSCEMTTRAMRNRVRSLEAEHGQLGLIVVDYIQIVSEAAGRGGSNANRAEALGKTARELHAMAGERKCTCLALSQLSRNVEQRDNKRPVLSDLRESGSIEAEANRVLFIYRDGYYRRDEAGGYGTRESGFIDDSIAEIILAKNRGGEIGTIRLRWIAPCTRFQELQPERPQATPDPAPVYSNHYSWEDQIPSE